jgi:para-nitrobenzyl esterase
LNGKLRTPHTLENAFVFDDTEGARFLTGGGPAVQALARRVSTAWVGFAASGDPNALPAGLPHWPAYDARRRAMMLFDDTSRVADDPTRDERLVLGEVLRRL